MLLIEWRRETVRQGKQLQLIIPHNKQGAGKLREGKSYIVVMGQKVSLNPSLC